MTSLQRPTTCPTYWRHATVCYTHYGSSAVMASQSLRYMMSFVLPSSRSWPTAHHRGPVHALPPTVLSWSHSSADARDLRTAAVKCQHTVILLMKLTILFLVDSLPTMDMFYSLSCPTVIPSLTVLRERPHNKTLLNKSTHLNNNAWFTNKNVIQRLVLVICIRYNGSPLLHFFSFYACVLYELHLTASK